MANENIGECFCNNCESVGVIRRMNNRSNGRLYLHCKCPGRNESAGFIMRQVKAGKGHFYKGHEPEEMQKPAATPEKPEPKKPESGSKPETKKAEKPAATPEKEKDSGGLFGWL